MLEIPNATAAIWRFLILENLLPLLSTVVRVSFPDPETKFFVWLRQNLLQLLLLQ